MAEETKKNTTGKDSVPSTSSNADAPSENLKTEGKKTKKPKVEEKVETTEKIVKIPTVKEEVAKKEDEAPKEDKKEASEGNEEKAEEKNKEADAPKEEKESDDKEKIKNAKDKIVEKLTNAVPDGKDKDAKKLETYRTMGEPSKVQKSQSAVQKTETKVKKEEKKEDVLERTYIVPMRRGFLKVPHYKRAKKAIKTLKEFLAKHMKVEDRDLKKVKIDIYLNNEIWFKGIKKPLSKIKVKVRKVDGIVYAELAEVPDAVKFAKQKVEKRKVQIDPKKMKKVVAQEAKEEKKKEGRSDKADKTETKEKEAATVEAGFEKNKDMAKAKKHTAKAKDAKMDKMSATTMRKALKK